MSENENTFRCPGCSNHSRIDYLGPTLLVQPSLVRGGLHEKLFTVCLVPVFGLQPADF